MHSTLTRCSEPPRVLLAYNYPFDDVFEAHKSEYWGKSMLQSPIRDSKAPEREIFGASTNLTYYLR